MGAFYSVHQPTPLDPCSFIHIYTFFSPVDVLLNTTQKREKEKVYGQGTKHLKEKFKATVDSGPSFLIFMKTFEVLWAQNSLFLHFKEHSKDSILRKVKGNKCRDARTMKKSQGLVQPDCGSHRASVQREVEGKH